MRDKWIDIANKCELIDSVHSPKPVMNQQDVTGLNAGAERGNLGIETAPVCIEQRGDLESKSLNVC